MGKRCKQTNHRRPETTQPSEVDFWRASMRRIAGSASQLFDQQMWQLGQDIQYPGGNLLLAYGMERCRPPVSARGSSRYHAVINVRHQLIMWGFGVYYGGQAQGLYLRRSNFMPMVGDAPSETLWSSDAFPRTKTPGDPATYLVAASLCHALCDWFGNYERWVSQTLSADDCERRIIHWPNRRKGCVPVGETASAWLNLGAQFAAQVSDASKLRGFYPSDAAPLAAGSNEAAARSTSQTSVPSSG